MSCIWYLIFFIHVIPEREEKTAAFEVLGSLRGDFSPRGFVFDGCSVGCDTKLLQLFFVSEYEHLPSQIPVNINSWSTLACMKLLSPLYILITNS